MSDTPRMKAAQMAALEHMTGDVYRVGCDIERELNESNQIIRQQQLLDEENFRLQERIQRLEDAGDGLLTAMRDDWSEYVDWIDETTDAIGKWHHAKEAKP